MNLICYIGLPVRLDNSGFVDQKLLNYDDTIYIHRRK